MISNYISMLKDEFKGYNLAKLAKDLMAGLTVAAVAIPLALAFGVSSGATAAAGLITAIVAGILISTLSGAYYQISGPTGAMAAVLMGVIAQYGLKGVFIATLIAGIILLLAGIFKLGVLTTFIPAPVITGFTSGISIIIAFGQLDNFFGTHSTGGSLIEKIGSYSSLGFQPKLATTLMAVLVVIALFIFPKKWNKVVPASLIAIIVTTAITMVFKLDVATVGKIPTSVISGDRLQLGSLDLQTVKNLIVPGASIALLGMIESLLCGASAGRMTGKALDSNQELIAQGIGNMILPFFGGIPATAAIARTSVAIKSGAQTRLTGIFHALALLVSMLLLAPIMAQIPLAALAGVLVVTSWRMNEWSAIKYLFKNKFKSALILFFLTLVSTVIFDLSTAIMMGVMVGIVIFVAKSSILDVVVEDVDLSKVETAQEGLKADWAVVYITGPLFFMSADRLDKALQPLHERDLVIFSLRGVPSIDNTAMAVIQDFYQDAQKKNHEVIFSSVQPNVMKMFERSGFEETAGKDAFYFSVDRVLKEIL
ncbi:SulP family inorganic anion transporter [Dellaglioa algida]|nr:SulP family inorganic anion transporter [Dellaglioa algida]MDK1716026.1 SulP family inorganic anion transporter [Dellaglioa algida]MDK1717708.1 SulP family inorganic anion transporter [Dellaglioa algida]MDK1719307.1 SulP family inorganic anion transporter [Dellaglioa algida]MDK1721191.1 SulP family inorganic anion transporter [Dellaglioa algida]MDK1722650.1 SulP family inorganic anion transporter [Dellaglioa algida]